MRSNLEVRRLVLSILIISLALFLTACSGGGGGSSGDETQTDSTPPSVASCNPANGATDVPVGIEVLVTFSEEIDDQTVNASSLILKQGANTVSGTAFCSGPTTATFRPFAALDESTTYTVLVMSSVMDLAGNHMSSDYSSTFTTGILPDTTPPTVTSTTPVDGATNVAVDISLSAIFSESMDPATIDASTFTLEDGDNNPISGTVAYSDTTATFTPDANLAYSTMYTATITTGVKDLAGNALSNEYSFAFTTVVEPLGTAEIIESNPDRASCPDTVIGPNGDAIVVWVQGPDHNSDDLWTNMYVAGTGWDTPEIIESSSTDIWGCPKIAIDVAGNAIAVWSQSGIIQSNRYVPGIGWGSPEVVGGGSGLNPDIAMDSNGNAIVVWEESRNILANRYVVGTGWGTPTLIESNTGEAYYPKVFVDQNGNTIAVWEQQQLGLIFRVWANRYTVGTGWSSAELIDSGTGGYISSVGVAGDSIGNAFAVWSQGDSSGYRIWANRYEVGTGWSTATPVESTVARSSGGARVTVDSNGNGIVVWRRRETDTSEPAIWTARYSIGTGWSSPEMISEEIGGTYPAIATNPSDRYTAVWRGEDQVLARQYTSATGWGTVKRLSTSFGTPYGLEVEAGANNSFIAVWSEAYAYDIWANLFQ